MRFRFIVTILLFASLNVIGQQASFQGKIYSGGLPVNGQHTIQFFIGPPLNWSSIPAIVNITNGLYSTVISYPKNLFDDTHGSREMIVYIDNNIIDTVTVFAALERDSIAKSYIRDSIKWSNVHDKPTIDTSFTNEYQQLSINADTLRITNGNAVKLPGIPKVYGNFNIVDTTKQNLINISGAGSSTCNGTTNNNIWQSFYSTGNGKIRELVIPVAVSSPCSSVIINFYEGTGVTSQSLGYKSFTVSNTVVAQALDFSAGVNSSSTGSLHLAAGKVYTFSITPDVGCYVSVSCNASNPYANGRSSINTNTDIVFSINTDHSTPSIFSVNKNGNVGLGIDSATAKLEVKGRIKDQSGFLVPVGTVFAYSGRRIPDGWLLCDGRTVSKTDYPDLYSEIDTSWGSGTGPGTFNLPDLRGMFLRGVDNSPTEGSSNNDPDKNARLSIKNGGNFGNNVGSAQTDIVKSHNHNSFTDPISGKVLYGMFSEIGSGVGTFSSNANIQPFNGGGSALYLHTLNNSALANYGGSETRPKNVAVYFIVKY